ncbi:protein C-mannosyl-transferase DPY19L3-like [Liolophura sinensis]|uniref:protein C-mannosyl-transferase DPY19L3-like n=1 Tax=Liolophura sinensis TaxID=3198878 RepID=UPI003159054E
MAAKGSDVRQRQKSQRISTVVNGNGRKIKEESANTSAGNLTSFANILSFLVGVLCMVVAGYKHAWLQFMLQETTLWFSNIQEVEREISFRTESGLYYSYYKQMLHSPSIQTGLYQLTHDNHTEHGHEINLLERMNIYQELILSIIYKILPIKNMVEPIYFYLYSIFSLQAVLVCALYVTAWLLSGSWLGGILTACFYIFNKDETTRVAYTAPLREHFSLPFLWVQIAAISYFFRPSVSAKCEKISTVVIVFASFFFTLGWQFNQFILLLQAFTLFGVWILDMVPLYKVRTVMVAQAGSLLTVCFLQFLNKMILGSLVLSFIPAALILMTLKGEKLVACSVAVRIAKVIFYSVSVLVLMLLLNMGIKYAINLDADEHIFKFLLAKFGVSYARDFDSRLYLCNGQMFNFLPFSTIEKLTGGLVLPIYVFVHFVLLLILAIAVLQNWSNNVHDSSVTKDHPVAKKNHLLSNRPELAFHSIQCLLFGALALTTLRMKYLWTPYMCILAGAGISDYKAWRFLLARCNMPGAMVQLVRHFVTLIVLVALLALALPPVLQELEDLKEFWDPDTVELVEWIKKDTPKTAAFAGSMQLLAAVKLCTGRPITNHPHYEDKHLRKRTKEIYQIYGKRKVEDVYEILKKYNTGYIILEDSICLAPSQDGCRLPDLIDVDNGMIPDSGKKEPGLVYSRVPRFCDQIRFGGQDFAKYFKAVFTNKTFRVYKLMDG